MNTDKLLQFERTKTQLTRNRTLTRVKVTEIVIRPLTVSNNYTVVALPVSDFKEHQLHYQAQKSEFSFTSETTNLQ